eukprot:2977479-Pyramimonas_sp.AAC.1
MSWIRASATGPLPPPPAAMLRRTMARFASAIGVALSAIAMSAAAIAVASSAIASASRGYCSGAPTVVKVDRPTIVLH